MSRALGKLCRVSCTGGDGERPQRRDSVPSRPHGALLTPPQGPCPWPQSQDSGSRTCPSQTTMVSEPITAVLGAKQAPCVGRAGRASGAENRLLSSFFAKKRPTSEGLLGSTRSGELGSTCHVRHLCPWGARRVLKTQVRKLTPREQRPVRSTEDTSAEAPLSSPRGPHLPPSQHSLAALERGNQVSE